MGLSPSRSRDVDDQVRRILEHRLSAAEARLAALERRERARELAAAEARARARGRIFLPPPDETAPS